MKLLKLLLLAILVCVCVSPSSVVAGTGGGDSGVDILPTALFDIEGPTTLITIDGSSWSEISDTDASSLVEAATITAVVDAGDSTFTLVGTGTAELESAVLAALASSPSFASSAVEPTASGTHPTPSRDEYKLKKTIITSKGTEKEIFKTLVVEKRGGESASEFQKRSERELRDAMDAGWESVG